MRTLGVALVLLAVAPARGEVRNELVSMGIKAYDDLDYPRAVRLLTRALDEPLNDEERREALTRLAYCHVAFEDEKATRADFQQLLRLDPGFKLDAGASQRMRALLDDVRAVMQPPPEKPQKPVVKPPETKPPETKPPEARPEAKPPSQLMPELDPHPLADEPLKVRTFIAGAAEVQLFHRPSGGGPWSKVTAEGHLGSFEATVPGMWVSAPGLDYYLVAVDDRGATVAAAGSEAQPLTVDVATRARRSSRAIVLGVVGAALVVGIAVAVITSLSLRVSPDTPSTIMVITH